MVGVENQWVPCTLVEKPLVEAKWKLVLRDISLLVSMVARFLVKGRFTVSDKKRFVVLRPVVMTT